MYNLKMAVIKRRNIVVPYVENTLYSTNKYSCVRLHTLYISYFIEHNGDAEPHGSMKVIKS